MVIRTEGSEPDAAGPGPGRGLLVAAVALALGIGLAIGPALLPSAGPRIPEPAIPPETVPGAPLAVATGDTSFGTVQWTAHPGAPSFLRSVVGWRDGMAAIAGPFPDTHLVHSVDGITWQSLQGAPAPDPVALSADGADLVVTGSGGTFWRSGDGIAWTPDPPEPAPVPDDLPPVPGATIHRATRSGNLHLALGTDLRGHPGAWLAQEGGAWVPVPESVAATLVVKPGWYLSPAFALDGRFLLQGMIDVVDPGACPTCTVRRSVIWEGVVTAARHAPAPKS